MRATDDPLGHYHALDPVGTDELQDLLVDERISSHIGALVEPALKHHGIFLFAGSNANGDLRCDFVIWSIEGNGRQGVAREASFCLLPQSLGEAIFQGHRVSSVLQSMADVRAERLATAVRLARAVHHARGAWRGQDGLPWTVRSWARGWAAASLAARCGNSFTSMMSILDVQLFFYATRQTPILIADQSSVQINDPVTVVTQKVSAFTRRCTRDHCSCSRRCLWWLCRRCCRRLPFRGVGSGRLCRLPESVNQPPSNPLFG